MVGGYSWINDVIGFKELGVLFFSTKLILDYNWSYNNSIKINHDPTQSGENKIDELFHNKIYNPFTLWKQMPSHLNLEMCNPTLQLNEKKNRLSS